MSDYYIKESSDKGRCVFANRDFTVGEIIESSPVIIFISEDSYSTNEEIIYRDNEKILLKTETYQSNIPDEILNIVFSWSSLTKNGKKESCIALGIGSLFNSANPANMIYMGDEENKMLHFIAIRNIQKYEELTINYSGRSGSNVSDDNYWFDNRDMNFKE